MRLWAAWGWHLALCVSGQLRHLLTLIPLTVSCQHGHRHRCNCHGNGISWLPGCHQGEQVPASKRKLNLHTYAEDFFNDSRQFNSSVTLSLLLFFLTSLHHSCKDWQKCPAEKTSYMLNVSAHLHSGRRPAGTLQCVCIHVLARTSQRQTSDRGSVCIVSNLRGSQVKLRASSGIFHFCKWTPLHSCHFHGFGHRSCQSKPHVLPIWLNYCPACSQHNKAKPILRPNNWDCSIIPYTERIFWELHLTLYKNFLLSTS